MKNLQKIISVLIAAVMLLSVVVIPAAAAPESITGSTSKTSEAIYFNGQATDAILTQYKLSSGSAYSKSSEGLVNVIEVPAGSENLTFAALNNGNYVHSLTTMGNAVLKYNETHDGSTVIAAVNAAPWLVAHTDYDGDGKSATGPGLKVSVSVPRSVTIIDGELWCTQQTIKENYLAVGKSAAEYGSSPTVAGVFGVAADGRYMISRLAALTYVQNTTTGAAKIKVSNGFNRLPAPDAITVYNYRSGTTSYAYSDAYEIYLTCEGGARVTLGSGAKGTVTAIFESGDESTRPAIDENTLVISARGSEIANIRNTCSIGDEIALSFASGGDRGGAWGLGFTWADWTSATQGVGGFFNIMECGKDIGQNLNENYPCTMLALKEDGTAMLVSSTSVADNKYHGTMKSQLTSLLKELGAYTVAMCDGGGSTSFLTLEEGTYVRRGSYYDGHARGVVNGLALVINAESTEPITNSEAGALMMLDGAIVTPPVEPDTPDDPDADPDADIVYSPSYSFPYVGHVDFINGVQYQELNGYRDPIKFDAATNADEKAAAITPAVQTGITVMDGNKISIKGWAQMRMGILKYVWSVDKYNWYDCTGEMRDITGDADETDIRTIGEQVYGITGATNANAKFNDLTADLSKFAGQTVDVHFGIVPAYNGYTDRAMLFLTLEDVVIPAAADTDTEAPEVSETEPEVSETEPVVSETEPAVSETEPAVSETEPTVSETEPTVSETEPAVSETEPVVSETEPVASETEPAVSETEPTVSETEPAVSETEPVASETEPVASETEPVVPDTEPVVSDTQPVVSDTETDAPAESKPADTKPAGDDGKEEGGCGSVAGISAIAIAITAAAAGALCFKKKED